MITIPKLLADLEGRGIILSRSGGALRYRAPRDAMTDADRQQLRDRRDEITDYLQAREIGMALRNVKGIAGPLTPSVTQEMWWRFAGGPDEGHPIALNIGMVRVFHETGPDMLAGAIRTVVARHETLRSRIIMQGEAMRMELNPADALEIERENFSGDMSAATDMAYAWCARLVPIEGPWLTRAKIFVLPKGGCVAALAASHAIADAVTRNIVLAEIEDVLAQDGTGGIAPGAPSVSYNAYALAERNFLAAPQGEWLIAYWRRWYESQLQMHSPIAGTPMQWGPGTRQLHNLVIPRRILDRVRRAATALGATPFLVYLTLYVMTLSRWSGMARFPIRILGDKRTAQDLSHTVGLMFCADAVEVEAPEEADFKTILRGILIEYEASQARRIPTLHFYAPQCVRPGIEARDFPNRIPAVFNYYSAGTLRERAQSDVAPDATLDMPWPPQVTRLPPQGWSRPSSPVFLHLMDVGTQGVVSFHFLSDVVNAAEQQAFLDRFFQIFAAEIPE